MLIRPACGLYGARPSAGRPTRASGGWRSKCSPRASQTARLQGSSATSCGANNAMRDARGLTLVELLVAIAIFGVLSGVAYRALTVVLESRGRLEQEHRKWAEVALFPTGREHC